MLKTREDLKESLKVFLSAYHKTKIIEVKDDTLKMYILLSKNRNKTPKEKLINFKLLRLQEILFSAQFSERESYICEFLIDELLKYVSKSIDKVQT